MLMLWSLMNMSKTLWSVMLLYGLHGDMTWESKTLWIHYDPISICNLSMNLWAKSYDLWVKPYESWINILTAPLGARQPYCRINSGEFCFLSRGFYGLDLFHMSQKKVWNQFEQKISVGKILNLGFSEPLILALFARFFASMDQK